VTVTANSLKTKYDAADPVLSFTLFRHDKHLVLLFFTRSLTTLAHLYNLVGWLKV
jgi:hypothetical protein